MTLKRTSAKRVTGLLAGNALAVGALLWASGAIPPVSRAGPPLLLIAHRGDTRTHPENSMAAILAARDGSADGIEVDVQRSADGTWWLFHDDTVDRLTGASGPFGYLSDDQVASLRLAGTDQHPPRLRDVVGALQEYGGWVYLDVKELNPTAAVGAIAEAQELPHMRVIVRSVAVAEAIRAAYPSLETLALTHVRGQETSPFITTWLANQIEITRPDTVSGKPRTVDAFIDLGTSDVAGIVERLSRFGVRAVITGLPQ